MFLHNINNDYKIEKNKIKRNNIIQPQKHKFKKNIKNIKNIKYKYNKKNKKNVNIINKNKDELLIDNLKKE